MPQNKYLKKMAEYRAHKYKRDLMDEINEDRREHGKKPFDDGDDGGGGETNSKTTKKEKEVKESTTDPESGLFQKGEKERCFAYTATVACDQNNFVLGVKVAPGNVHDSQVFTDVFSEVTQRFPEINSIVVDAGYKTPGICREIIMSGKKPVMPYKRPMTKDGFFKKYEYVYDEYYDCFICPENHILDYSTTNRKGYAEYKSTSEICRNCPSLQQCTHSHNHTKVVSRHIWEPYMEIAEDIRHTKEGKELYKKRGETIERVFADAKEKHGMRYTLLRGLGKVQHYLTFLFACVNLKKLAMRKKKNSGNAPGASTVSIFLSKFLSIGRKNTTPLICVPA